MLTQSALTQRPLGVLYDVTVSILRSHWAFTTFEHIAFHSAAITQRSQRDVASIIVLF